jgi:hypothetical protein
MPRHRASDTLVYRPDRRPDKDPSAGSVEHNRMIYPHYRGFKLACLSGEFEARKRAVDEYWVARYFGEQTLSGRKLVMQEEGWLRFNPREWTV